MRAANGPVRSRLVVSMRPVRVPGPSFTAGFLHVPDGPVHTTAVLLVPPFGWDDQGAYRPRRAWAEALAAAGHPALRIDLPGAGDSEGHPRDDGWIDSATGGIVSCVAWLRAEAGAGRVAIVAMGLGGLLTLRAIGQGLEVDDLVLWGVPATGRAVVRELKAFGRLEASQTGEDVTAVPEGEIRAGGHVLSPETTAELGALTAAGLLGERRPGRALVLARDGVGPDDDLLDALDGIDVATHRGDGWGDTIAGADESEPPSVVIAAVETWLRDDRDGTLTVPEGFDDVVFDVGGTRLRETPLLLTGGAGRLYGVLTEPVDVPARATAVLLNAGALRHIGPNRMWTEAARRWAADGVATFRMDFEGIGDADGERSAYTTVDTFHHTRFARQLSTALDALAARGLPARFVIAGMCSGAYWAFQGALADERVRGAIGVNQRQFFWSRQAESRKELRRLLRIVTPRGFRNVLIGERRLQRLWRLVKWVATMPVTRLLNRGNGVDRPQEQLAAALDILHSRGQSLELAFSVAEPMVAELEAAGLTPVLERLGIPMHDLPYFSHTLKPVPAQHAAHAVLDEALARMLPADGAPAPAAPAPVTAP